LRVSCPRAVPQQQSDRADEDERWRAGLAAGQGFLPHPSAGC
jgi:hypothetical protein